MTATSAVVVAIIDDVVTCVVSVPSTRRLPPASTITFVRSICTPPAAPPSPVIATSASPRNELLTSVVITPVLDAVITTSPMPPAVISVSTAESTASPTLIPTIRTTSTCIHKALILKKVSPKILSSAAAKDESIFTTSDAARMIPETPVVDRVTPCPIVISDSLRIEPTPLNNNWLLTDMSRSSDANVLMFSDAACTVMLSARVTRASCSVRTGSPTSGITTLIIPLTIACADRVTAP